VRPPRGSDLLGRLSLSVTRHLPAWAKPRLAHFEQYEPRPVLRPPSYGDVDPPRNAPRISVVTPSLDQGEFIEQTLRSVLDQGYPNLEYIVQDGGSTDGTLSILDRYEPQLAHLASEPDRGQADAINRGFQKSSGDVLAYLNADDLLLPGSLSTVGRFFADHPDVDVAYGHRIVIDRSGREIGRWVLPPHDDDALRWVDYVPQETVFWRRRVWRSTGSAMTREFDLVLDWELLLRFLESGAKFVRLNRFIAAVRSHAGQKSQRYVEHGAIECRKLRARYLGRLPSDGEIASAIRPYHLKQLLWHAGYRLGIVRP
jgi:glycosyltransferase involved in cell wall biosynthesis